MPLPPVFSITITNYEYEHEIAKGRAVITLTKLNGTPFLLNADLIREVEATPDTIVTLSSGQKILVQESVEAVRKAVIEYKRAIFRRDS